MKALVAEEISVPLAPDQATESATPATVSDRRQYVARIPIEIPLRIATHRHSASAISVDISVTGLQARTPIPLTLGDRVLLSLPNEESKPDLTICAVVVRADVIPALSRAARQNPQGMAQMCQEAARLSALKGEGNLPSYGLRILRDDSVIWQDFVRMQVLNQ